MKAVSWKRHLEILTTKERWTDVGLLILKEYHKKAGNQLSHQSTVGRTNMLTSKKKKLIKIEEQISDFLSTEEH